MGASGDLAPLAHIALVLIGEGEAEFEGVRQSGADALKRARIEPIVLASKEGISLVNGTQAMLAVGCLELLQAETLAFAADTVCAMTLDGLRGTPRAFDPRLHEVRPHPGQLASAANLARLLEASEIRESHITCRRVQDAYSLRCAPQVHGAVRDTLAEARRCFEIELNSVTDNPLVFGDEIISGGNFHGEPLALQLDSLAVAMTVLAGISERRIDRLVNPALNEELPPFLTGHAGPRIRIHDAASHSGRSGGGESRAVASGFNRFHHNQRQQGRLRQHGDDVGAQAETDRSKHAQRTRHRAAHRNPRVGLPAAAQIQPRD